MLNRPPNTANNGFQWAIASAPPDSDSKYAEGPFATIPENKVKSLWFQIFDIGTESRTGSNQASYASPLAAGSIQRIKTDSSPEFWIVSTLVGAATAHLSVWPDADPVGFPVRLGNGGTCCIPSRGKPFLTLQAINIAIVGTVIAFSGYDPNAMYLFAGNQA